MNINNYFDKYLDIITEDDKKIHIERKQLYIHDSSDFSGEANIMKKGNNVYVIKEVYSLDNSKRLRYSYIKYINAKVFDTYEINKNGIETPITVIESFDEKKILIGSIGKICKIESDKINKTNERNKERPKILQLLLRKNKNNNEETKLENLLVI